MIPGVKKTIIRKKGWNMSCPKSVNTVFSDINFNDPDFPWSGPINGQFEIPKMSHSPAHFCEFLFQTPQNSDGVYQLINVTTGDNYYNIRMIFYRQVGQVLTSAPAFSGAGATIPLQNAWPYGGSATIV